MKIIFQKLKNLENLTKLQTSSLNSYNLLENDKNIEKLNSIKTQMNMQRIKLEDLEKLKAKFQEINDKIKALEM